MRPSILLFALLVASPASAQFCNLDLKYENGQVRWKAITGATRYTVLETYGELKEPFYYSTRNNFVNVTRRASAPVRVRYIVTAEVEPDIRIMATWNDACTGTIEVILPQDDSFRGFTRRAILPVVGSTPGAFGGQFRTSLELRGAANEKGRIVFHPAGRVAADSDPSIPYSFIDTRVMTFDDIVAAMGQSGIGSLELIPDADSVDRIPQTQVRLYNDTSLGTFGTFTEPKRPYDYLRHSGFQLRMPDARFRVNIGIRTLTETRVSVVFQRADGRLDGLFNRTFPAGWTEMTAASDFLGGKALEPGHLLTIAIEGSAIPFYTITENRTNDPTLIVPPPDGASREVGEFVD